MLFSILIIPSYITIRKYFLLFHFHEIKNNNSLEENVDLVSQFLSEQHFVAYCHPLAPEIFQIFSKNIDPFGDEREVLVFIADENRFLINSHFTSSKIKYKIFISPSRQREVIKAFKGWLKTKTLNKELAVTKHANNSAI
jgi:dihydropteroate synthase